MPYGLEIDHVAPLEFGGVTSLDNLALLCRHDHGHDRTLFDRSPEVVPRR
jgi:5-methylcytosine-specific restriction endonuclease McrA